MSPAAVLGVFFLRLQHFLFYVRRGYIFAAGQSQRIGKWISHQSRKITRVRNIELEEKWKEQNSRNLENEEKEEGRRRVTLVEELKRRKKSGKGKRQKRNKDRRRQIERTEQETRTPHSDVRDQEGSE